MANWNDNIEGDHLTIAGTPATPLRVLAGPGTGKTYALMRRIQRLIEEGADPSRILVSTFTRTAAKDLESELAKLGVQGADKVRAGTLHALSFGILSREEVLPITGRNPRPLMDFETRFLVEDLCSETGLDVDECKAMLRTFNAAWARVQNDTPGWLDDADDQNFDTALRNWLTAHKAMLIGELVPECRKYLKGNPLCADRSAFDHVLVDEFQDLNRAEQEVLELLAEKGTLTIIGDDNQSIYSFKHAHPEGIVDFHQSHPATTSHSLTVCQRCPTDVVAISNALLVSGDAKARQLQPHPKKGAGEVHIVQWPSITEEASGLASIIKKRVDAGKLKPGKILILAQRRQFGYAIRDALIAAGVPAHSFFSEQELDGNPKLKDDYEAQEAFTLLTLLAAPNDPAALRCWCGFGSSSLRSGEWKRMSAYADASHLGLREVMEKLAGKQVAVPHTTGIVARYKALKAREAACAGLTGAKLLDAVFPVAADWSEPLRALADGIEEKDYSAEDLVDAVRSGVVQPEMPVETDYVRIMSLHKSKGLTADFVAVVGLLEGIVPSTPNPKKTAAEQARQAQEDRRVFYVAITRPRETLFLSSVTHLSMKDGMKMRVQGNAGRGVIRTFPSRFLSQLGPKAPAPVNGNTLI